MAATSCNDISCQVPEEVVTATSFFGLQEFDFKPNLVASAHSEVSKMNAETVASHVELQTSFIPSLSHHLANRPKTKEMTLPISSLHNCTSRTSRHNPSQCHVNETIFFRMAQSLSRARVLTSRWKASPWSNCCIARENDRSRCREKGAHSASFFQAGFPVKQITH